MGRSKFCHTNISKTIRKDFKYSVQQEPLGRTRQTQNDMKYDSVARYCNG